MEPLLKQRQRSELAAAADRSV